MSHWNKLFWLLFIVIGAFVVASMIVRVLYLDIMLGVFVIALGVLKLGEELSSKEITDRHTDINDNIRYLSHQVDAGNLFARKVKEKHEHRFLKIDSRRNDIEGMVEERYDSLAKKLIQMENRLNDVAKAVVHVSRKHDAFSKDAGKEIKKIARLRYTADKMSEKLRKITASKPSGRPAARKKALKASKGKK